MQITSDVHITLLLVTLSNTYCIKIPQYLTRVAELAGEILLTTSRPGQVPPLPFAASAPLRPFPSAPDGRRHAQGSGMRAPPRQPMGGGGAAAAPPTARGGESEPPRASSASRGPDRRGPLSPPQPPGPRVTLRPSPHPAGPGPASHSPAPGAGSSVPLAGDAARLREQGWSSRGFSAGFRRCRAAPLLARGIGPTPAPPRAGDDCLAQPRRRRRSRGPPGSAGCGPELLPGSAPGVRAGRAHRAPLRPGPAAPRVPEPRHMPLFAQSGHAGLPELLSRTNDGSNSLHQQEALLRVNHDLHSKAVFYLVFQTLGIVNAYL